MIHIPPYIKRVLTLLLLLLQINSIIEPQHLLHNIHPHLPNIPLIPHILPNLRLHNSINLDLSVLLQYNVHPEIGLVIGGSPVGELADIVTEDLEVVGPGEGLGERGFGELHLVLGVDDGGPGTDVGDRGLVDDGAVGVLNLGQGGLEELEVPLLLQGEHVLALVPFYGIDELEKGFHRDLEDGIVLYGLVGHVAEDEVAVHHHHDLGDPVDVEPDDSVGVVGAGSLDDDVEHGVVGGEDLESLDEFGQVLEVLALDLELDSHAVNCYYQWGIGGFQQALRYSKYCQRTVGIIIILQIIHYYIIPPLFPISQISIHQSANSFLDCFSISAILDICLSILLTLPFSPLPPAVIFLSPYPFPFFIFSSLFFLSISITLLWDQSQESLGKLFWKLLQDQVKTWEEFRDCQLCLRDWDLELDLVWDLGWDRLDLGEEALKDLLEGTRFMAWPVRQGDTFWLFILRILDDSVSESMTDFLLLPLCLGFSLDLLVFRQEELKLLDTLDFERLFYFDLLVERGVSDLLVEMRVDETPIFSLERFLFTIMDSSFSSSKIRLFCLLFSSLVSLRSTTSYCVCLLTLFNCSLNSLQSLCSTLLISFSYFTSLDSESPTISSFSLSISSFNSWFYPYLCSSFALQILSWLSLASN